MPKLRNGRCEPNACMYHVGSAVSFKSYRHRLPEHEDSVDRFLSGGYILSGGLVRRLCCQTATPCINPKCGSYTHAENPKVNFLQNQSSTKLSNEISSQVVYLTLVHSQKKNQKTVGNLSRPNRAKQLLVQMVWLTEPHSLSWIKCPPD